MIYKLRFKFNVPTDSQTQDEYTDNIALTFKDRCGLSIRGLGTPILTIDLDAEGESEDATKDYAQSLIEQSMPAGIYKSGQVLGISKYDNPAEINEHY